MHLRIAPKIVICVSAVLTLNANHDARANILGRSLRRACTEVSTSRVSGWDQQACRSSILIPSAHADGTDRVFVSQETSRMVDDRPLSPRLATLQDRLKSGDRGALANFWKEIEERGAPIIEPAAGNDRDMLVTMLWRATEETKNVFVFRLGDVSKPMARLLDTDLWYKTFRLQKGARFIYQFATNLPDPKEWRVINGTVQAFINAQFKAVDNSNTATVAYRQTAQDGIQLAWKNYSSKQNANPPIRMAPANRMDLLVQAPDKPGCYVLQYALPNGNLVPLLYINVTDTKTPMKFPGTDPKGGITIEADYPPMPKFLRDIVKVVEPPKRDPIVYGSRQDPAPSPTPADYGKRTLLQFTIGTPQHPNKQFNGEVDQVMTLGDAEEWQIENMDTIQKIRHPFHIHINPFQITEIFDPASMIEPLKLQPPYVWWDTFPIPAPSNVYPDQKPRLDKAGKQTFVAGYFKMRTRFVDFTGLYVQHCHILAHEDRGMMQLLQVCNDPNSPECKKQAMKAEHH